MTGETRAVLKEMADEMDHELFIVGGYPALGVDRVMVERWSHQLRRLLAALHASPVEALIAKWRANADMLAEGNKGEWPDPAVGMQRACADELEAALHASGEQEKEEK